MEGERVVFTEENDPRQYVRLVACGEVDGMLLDALGDYIKRQKRRLEREEQRQADYLNENTAEDG